MGTDVAAFARQLKEDGILAARQEAETIIQEARKKAESMLADGARQVQAMKQAAEEDIARQRQKSEAAVRLAARDLMLEVRKQVEQIGTVLLTGPVKQALATPEIVKSALTELLKTQKSGQDWELALGPTVGKPLAEAVLQDLFKAHEARVKLAEGLKKAGFELTATSGTEVIEVTDDSVTEAFSKLMSPELAKMLAAKLAKA